MLSKFEDFEVKERLDETHGGTTQILLGIYQDQLLVCKSIQKRSLQDTKSIQHMKNEKESLKHFSDKGSKRINKLINTFQDSQKLYMVLEPVKGLPLHKLLQMVGKFNPEFTRLIAIQVGLILKQFHEEGFIYRDIKASNFMIDEKGRVNMIDLGHSKRINKDRTYTICGTTHAMPPQIYKKQGYSYQFDYYGFGILIYQMLIGKAPFGYGNSNPNIIKDMQEGLKQGQLAQIECDTTKDLIKKLLEDVEKRLGIKGGLDEILEHDYFNVPEFLDVKDIYDELSEIDSKDPNFEFYISEIVDFGLDEEKFKEISPDDPFYKFFG